jgi:acetyl-CoA carboxylase biotin carboxyl carrier protein
MEPKMKFKDIDIERLLELMKKYKTGEIILKDGKTAIEVRNIPHSRHHHRLDESFEPELPSDRAAERDTMPTPASEKEPEREVGQEMAAQESTNNYTEIKAPLVGTFYRASAPGEDPFVELGDRVNVGDTLCIVEAMKNMNEIESDVSGIVREICIQNAEMVEYGQILLKIEEAG